MEQISNLFTTFIVGHLMFTMCVYHMNNYVLVTGAKYHLDFYFL